MEDSKVVLSEEVAQFRTGDCQDTAVGENNGAVAGGDLNVLVAVITEGLHEDHGRQGGVLQSHSHCGGWWSLTSGYTQNAGVLVILMTELC